MITFFITLAILTVASALFNSLSNDFKKMPMHLVIINNLIGYLALFILYYFFPTFALGFMMVLSVFNFVAYFYFKRIYSNLTDEIYAAISHDAVKRDMKIIATIEPDEIESAMTDEYKDIQSRIENLVNSPKPHSKEQVAAYIDYRNRQTQILREYSER